MQKYHLYLVALGAYLLTGGGQAQAKTLTSLPEEVNLEQPTREQEVRSILLEKPLSLKQFENLPKHLERFPNLEQLVAVLDNHAFQDRDFSDFAQQLKTLLTTGKLTQFQSLTLMGGKPSKKAIETILDAIKVMPKPVRLRMDINPVNLKADADLFLKLAPHQSEEMWGQLAGYNLKTGFDNILAFLKEKKPTQIDLSQTGIGFAEVKKAVDMVLMTHPDLESLILNKNVIGSGAAVTLARLGGHPALKTLELAHIGLRNTGIIIFLKELPRDNALTTLDLSDSSLTEAGIKAVIQAFKEGKLSNLTDLTLKPKEGFQLDEALGTELFENLKTSKLTAFTPRSLFPDTLGREILEKHFEVFDG